MSVRLDHLCKRFGAREILRGVELDVPSGACLGLLGVSGSGKTTVLRIIAGLERPDAGKVTLGERAVDDGRTFVPPHARRVGMVFQDLALWPHLTAEQHLTLVTRALNLGRGERRRLAGEWLERCHLENVRRSRPDQLSGGEKQRLALARTLLPEPRVLLLDEPYTGLDPELGNEMKALVARFHRDQGLTTIIVSHDPRDMEGLADSCVRLRDGVIADDAPMSSPAKLPSPPDPLSR